MFSKDLYKESPLSFCDGIPTFCEDDPYTDNYERIAADHLTSVREVGENPFMREELWLEIEGSTAALIGEISSEGQRVLDVGVGLGRLLARFGSLDRFGVDISMEYLRESQESGIEVCRAFVENLPYRDELFDLVVSTDVLEHVLDLNAACQQMVRCLKPGGYLLVRVPYREDLSGYADKSCKYDFVHLRNFDEHSLYLNFVKIHGLEAIRFETAGTAPAKERLRWPTPFRIVNGAFCKLSRATRFGRRIAKGAFFDTEINYLFKKPEGV